MRAGGIRVLTNDSSSIVSDFRCKSIKETSYIHIQSEKKYQKLVFFSCFVYKNVKFASRQRVFDDVAAHFFRNK